MLGMKSYSKEYVAACRARVASGLAVYRKHIGKNGSSEMEHRFFNDQVLVLDHMFVHRLTGIEGKDGNPLNEVRVLCNSLLPNKGISQIEKLPGWPNSASFWDQTAAGEVRAETSDWRRDQTDRSRLRAPIGGFLQRNRKEVRLRFWSTGAIEDNSRGAPPRNTDTPVVASWRRSVVLPLLQGSVCSHIAHTICLHRRRYAEKADLHPRRIS